MRAAIVLALAAGCSGDLDPAWQLDHDRIIAVRATPPAIPAHARAELDGLVAAKGGKTSERPPELATVVSPESLATALTTEDGRWFVTAPDEARLADVRVELGLAAGAAVPLRIGVAYAGGTLLATKLVWLGMTADQPALEGLAMDGAPIDGRAELVVAPEVDVRLSVAAEIEDDVNWLTSVGDLHDYDLPQAYVRVAADAERLDGELAVVRRDDRGGVVWRVWPIRVAPR